MTAPEETSPGNPEGSPRSSGVIDRVIISSAGVVLTVHFLPSRFIRENYELMGYSRNIRGKNTHVYKKFANFTGCSEMSEKPRLSSSGTLVQISHSDESLLASTRFGFQQAYRSSYETTQRRKLRSRQLRLIWRAQLKLICAPGARGGPDSQTEIYRCVVSSLLNRRYDGLSMTLEESIGVATMNKTGRAESAEFSSVTDMGKNI